MTDQNMRRSDDQMIDMARGLSRVTVAVSCLRQHCHHLITLSSDHLIVCALLLTGISAFGQRSPFNDLEVLPADSTGHYRILIGGHFHGESTNRSGYPAATLLANLDTINSLGANLFLSTGDLFMDPVNDMPRYQRALFSKLKMPLFNAPGNHDHSAGAPPDSIIWFDVLHIDTVVSDTTGFWYGQSSSARIHLFDTEREDGSIDGTQLKGLQTLAEAEEWGKEKFPLFVISHRPIWSEDDPQYSPLFKDNTRSLSGTNFQKDVYPLLEKIAEHAHVYWISGSLGGSAPSSIFFQEHSKNITYIQCAIRDEPRDALLIADVYPDTVKWSSFSLTGQKLLAPEAYNAPWWREHIGKSDGFNWRLLPYLVKTTVLRKEFWWGVLGGVLALMLIRRLYRR